MTRYKIENVNLLWKWLKSWKKIWSRAIPHHLYKYENDKYKLAQKKNYLYISSKDRENLQNIWSKYCIAKNIKNLVLIKKYNLNEAFILLDDKQIFNWKLKDCKNEILKYKKW